MKSNELIYALFINKVSEKIGYKETLQLLKDSRKDYKEMTEPTLKVAITGNYEKDINKD